MTQPPSTAADSARPSFEHLQQAAQWFALLQAESVSDADRLRWEEWLRKDHGARSAWRQVESVAQDFSSIAHLPARDLLNRTSAAGARRRRDALRMLALVPVAGVAGWLVSRELPWRGWVAAHRTQTGERREIALEDGSRLWLNTSSAVDVDFSGAYRRVIVHEGEVLVTTGHDPTWKSRPLVVEVAQGRFTALGTRFAVRRDARAQHTTRVTVFEGAVRAQPARTAGALTVRAGEQADLFSDRVDTPVQASAGGDSWTEGLLVAKDMRLGDFIDELSRYRRGYLGCAPELRGIRLVGSYPLADTDRVLAALQATLPIRVNKVLPWWVVVEPPQGHKGRS